MDKPRNSLSRRSLFAGASVVGAAAVAVTLVPGVRDSAQALVETKAAPVKGGGYSLSEHVKQYYKTTLI